MNGSVKSKKRVSKNKKPPPNLPEGRLVAERDGTKKRNKAHERRCIAVREPCYDDNECCDLEDEL